MGRKILLVEDDRETASYLAKGLSQEGHSVEQATNGQDGLFRATDGSFDLVILDRMLPVLDGLSVLKALRAAHIETPVLILSALASVGDRIEGLEHGSDDYLVKPFSFAELLARVNALLRRRESRVDPAEHRLTVGDLEIDPLSRSVKRRGKKLDLKPREYLLLEYFARNEGRVVTRTMLLEQVWDYHFDPGTNVIDVHVSRLRRKLDEGFEKPLLHTVRGAGYMLAGILALLSNLAVIGFIYFRPHDEAVATVHQQVLEQGKVLADVYRSGGLTALDDAIDDTMTYADPQTIIALLGPDGSEIKGNLEPVRSSLVGGPDGYRTALIRLHGQTTPHEAALVVHRLA